MFLLAPFVSAFVIYLLTVWITEDKSLTWWDCVIWMVGMSAAGLLVRFGAGAGLLHLDYPFPEVFGILASLAALILILYLQGIRLRHVWIITGLYIVVRAGLFLPLLLLRAG